MISAYWQLNYQFLQLIIAKAQNDGLERSSIPDSRGRSRLPTERSQCKAGFCILPEGDQKMVQPYKLKKLCEIKEFQSHFWLLSHPQMRNSARVKAFWDFSLDTFNKGCL
ncbi:hypothetical protein ACCI51_02030 [Microbulbifer echini]|uniref:Uncharacterized protein n=1 Tax=Microbulbifer echini TaxID=1529067 RepID=A0ABV4NJR3_9GAMM